MAWHAGPPALYDAPTAFATASPTVLDHSCRSIASVISSPFIVLPPPAICQFARKRPAAARHLFRQRKRAVTKKRAAKWPPVLSIALKSVSHPSSVTHPLRRHRFERQ